MEWLEGGASGSTGQSDVEANVSGFNLHMRRKERRTDGWNTKLELILVEEGLEFHSLSSTGKKSELGVQSY